MSVGAQRAWLICWFGPAHSIGTPTTPSPLPGWTPPTTSTPTITTTPVVTQCGTDPTAPSQCGTDPDSPGYCS